MRSIEARLRKLEARQGDHADSLLAGLNYDQGQALLTFLMTLLGGVEEPSNERLRGSGLSRDRYEAALASIPTELRERFIAAYVVRAAERAKA
jgi:hypothetical protein